MLRFLLYTTLGYLAWRLYRETRSLRPPRRRPPPASPRAPGFAPGQIVDAEFHDLDDQGERPR